MKNENREKIRWLLTQWGKAEETIGDLEQEIWDIRERIDAETDVRPAPLSGLPSGGKVSDKTASAAQRHAAAVQRHSLRLDFLEAERARVQEIVQMMDTAMRELRPIEKKVLRHRYKYGKTCQEIAVAVKYSYDGVRAINDSAMDKLVRIVHFCEKS